MSMTNRQEYVIMWTLYYIMGGVYFLPIKYKVVKYLFLVISSFIILFVAAATVIYISTAQSLRLENVLYGLATLNGCIFTCIFIPLLAFIFRREFITIMKYIDASDKVINLPLPPINVDQQQFDIGIISAPKKSVINLYMMRWWFVSAHLIGPLSFIMIPLFHTFILYPFPHEDVQHYPFPIPFTDHISSILAYLLIYTIQSCLYIYTINLAMVLLSFLIMVTYMLKNITDFQCYQMRCLTKVIQSKSDRQWEYKLRSEVADWFEECLFHFIERHQEIIRITKEFRTFVSVIGSCSAVAALACQICILYLIVKSSPDMVIKVRSSCMAMIIFCFFYAFCEIGTLFNEMHLNLCSVIYQLPWYQVPYSIRATIFIWQCQLSQERPIKCFKIYILRRALFVPFLRIVYTVANVLNICSQ